MSYEKTWLNLFAAAVPGGGPFPCAGGRGASVRLGGCRLTSSLSRWNQVAQQQSSKLGFHGVNTPRCP